MLRNKVRKNNDVAALAGAAIAASVSILSGSGEFSLVSAAIGLSLLVIVLVYSWECTNNKEERIAFSVVFSLLLMIVYSPLIEFFIHYIGCNHSVIQCLFSFGTIAPSKVNGNLLFFGWFLSTPILYFTFTVLSKLKIGPKYFKSNKIFILNTKVILTSVCASLIITSIYAIIGMLLYENIEYDLECYSSFFYWMLSYTS